MSRGAFVVSEDELSTPTLADVSAAVGAKPPLTKEVVIDAIKRTGEHYAECIQIASTLQIDRNSLFLSYRDENLIPRTRAWCLHCPTQFFMNKTNYSYWPLEAKYAFVPGLWLDPDIVALSLSSDASCRISGIPPIFDRYPASIRKRPEYVKLAVTCDCRNFFSALAPARHDPQLMQAAAIGQLQQGHSAYTEPERRALYEMFSNAYAQDADFWLPIVKQSWRALLDIPRPWPQDWSVNDVVIWVKRVAPEIEDLSAFERYHITGVLLLNLNAKDFKNFMIQPNDARLKIIDGIKKLKEGHSVQFYFDAEVLQDAAIQELDESRDPRDFGRNQLTRRELYDSFPDKYARNPNFWLPIVVRDWRALNAVPVHVVERPSEDVTRLVLAAAEQEITMLEHLPKESRDESVMLPLVQQNWHALNYVDHPTLEMIRAAVDQSPQAFQYVRQPPANVADQRAIRNLAVAHVERHPMVLQYMTEWLTDNTDVVVAAYTALRQRHKQAEELEAQGVQTEYTGHPDVAPKVMRGRQMTNLLSWASPRLRNEDLLKGTGRKLTAPEQETFRLLMSRLEQKANQAGEAAGSNKGGIARQTWDDIFEDAGQTRKRPTKDQRQSGKYSLEEFEGSFSAGLVDVSVGGHAVAHAGAV